MEPPASRQDFSTTDVIWLFVSDVRSASCHSCTFSVVTMGNGGRLATTLGLKDLCGTSLSIVIIYFAFTPLSPMKTLRILGPSLLAVH